jgi:hypothetical protein
MLKDNIISKTKAFELANDLHNCWICGNEDCDNPKECNEIMKYVKGFYGLEIVIFNSALDEIMRHYTGRYDWEDLESEVEPYPIEYVSDFIFKNGSMGSSFYLYANSSHCRNLDFRIYHNDSKILSVNSDRDIICNNEKEYNDWLMLLEMDEKDSAAGYEYISEDGYRYLTVDRLYNRWIKPIDLKQKIKEKAEEYKVTKKIKSAINRISISSSGYCKPIKYKPIHYEKQK